MQSCQNLPHQFRSWAHFYLHVCKRVAFGFPLIKMQKKVNTLLADVSSSCCLAIFVFLTTTAESPNKPPSSTLSTSIGLLACRIKRCWFIPLWQSAAALQSVASSRNQEEKYKKKWRVWFKTIWEKLFKKKYLVFIVKRNGLTRLTW